MQCVTIKPGIECFFMQKSGCSYPKGACNPIDARCQGCSHVLDSPSQTNPGGQYCKVYADPAAKWMLGTCNYATHIETTKAAEAKKVNPLKASKRAIKGGR